MNKRKFLLTALVVIVLGALVYLQVRTWRKFDWQSFKEQTEDVNIGLIVLGVASHLLRLLPSRAALEDPAAAGVRREDFAAGCANHDWLYRDGLAGTARRVHTSISDWTQRKSHHVFAVGCLGGGAIV